jgi:deoxyribonuclease IV
MWRASTPDPIQVGKFQTARQHFDLSPLAIHVNYLVNLASLDPVIRTKSVQSFRGELQRAAILGADYLVLHPGSHRDHSVEEGIAAFVLGLQEAAQGLTGIRTTVLLENTVGAGCHLGARLEQLHFIRDLASELTDLSIGYCLDTCHLLAAGFDIVTPAGLNATLRAVDEHLGLANVRLFHANDSKAPIGSRIDRHAHIGDGHIGTEAFRRILRHPKLRGKPFILETPIDNPCDDRRNLDMLKSLARRAEKPILNHR